jgi:hypothetical protein
MPFPRYKGIFFQLSSKIGMAIQEPLNDGFHLFRGNLSALQSGNRSKGDFHK